LAKLAEDRFWYGSAAASESHDWDWLSERLPEDGVRLRNRTAADTILVLAGPRSRELLRTVSPRTDWSNEAFPWLTAKAVTIGHAEALAMRVSFSGELGWELHLPNEQLYLAHQILDQAGAGFGLADFGLLATESMRLEKCYRHWKADLISEYDPFESSLERFVNLQKPDFPGKQALLQRRVDGPRRKFVPLIVEGDIAPAHAGDAIYAGDELVGTVTSGGFGHRVGRNIALGFVDAAQAELGTGLEIGIIGRRYEATVVSEPIFDAANERLRA
jgi:dimethylglycine dehydrogenase